MYTSLAKAKMELVNLQKKLLQEEHEHKKDE